LTDEFEVTVHHSAVSGVHLRNEHGQLKRLTLLLG